RIKNWTFGPNLTPKHLILVQFVFSLLVARQSIFRHATICQHGSNKYFILNKVAALIFGQQETTGRCLIHVDVDQITKAKLKVPEYMFSNIVLQNVSFDSNNPKR